MLTIFSIPKPFEGAVAVNQHNAIESWTRLGGCEIILIGDDPGVAEAARRHNVRHLPYVDRTATGTPMLDSAFGVAEREATYSLFCFVNADIILFNDLLSALALVLNRTARFLMVGRRINLDVPESIAFEGKWEEDIREDAARAGHLHAPTGSDYFVWPKGLFARIPPFAIGRTSWDNWLMFEARRMGADLIDATSAVTAVHQNHDYGHVRGGHHVAWKGSEAQRNFALAGGARCIYTIDDATLLIRDGTLVSAFLPQYWYRHLRAEYDRLLTDGLVRFPRLRQAYSRLRHAIGKKVGAS